MLIDALPLAFAVWIIFSSYAQHGAQPQAEANRMIWLQRLGLVLLALAAPNPWVGALMVLPLISWNQEPLLRTQVEPLLLTTLLWAGIYSALAPHVTLEWLPWILGAVLSVGVIQGVWMLHSLCIPERPYQRVYSLFGYKLYVWELASFPHPSAGCGNPNHTEAVSAMATAAGIGLVLLGVWWVWPLVGLASIAVVYGCLRWGDTGPSSAIAYVVVLVCTFPLFLFPVLLPIGVCLGVAAITCVWKYYPTCLSERPAIWTWLWQQHRSGSWYAQLIGYSTGSWIRRMMQTRPFASLVIQPHNEFLMLLYEHGWLGVGILLGYLGTGVWTALHAGPAGLAVVLLGAVVVTCALISSPWQPYTEVMYQNQQTKQIEVCGQGAPAINVISFATMLCVEAIR